MAPKQGEHAVEFERIIHAGRERKRNEALAAKIFGRGDKNAQRRASAPIKPGAGGSLASRVGVKKQRVSTGGRAPTGNIDGDWTHDLHNPNEGRKPSLAARVNAVSGPPLTKSQSSKANRTAKLANAFQRTAASNAQQLNIRSQMPTMSIKGLAGPFAVLAQNFAPGTTAADIESAMTPVGGIVSSCRLVKTQPIVIAEVVFESKEGAENVIQTFDKQNADGRTLSVYMKPGGFSAAPPKGPRNQQSNETRLGDNSILVDGSHGFSDPRDTDNNNIKGRLYSDKLSNVHNSRGSRRGR
ncbi:hypothetical protein F5Y18DRAFT_225984 [Xylariaceae sp. FL1019]|nr:hypothetical protein F5Y18DRAFT_225984 [Xylariaceae sp. FL1019]